MPVKEAFAHSRNKTLDKFEDFEEVIKDHKKMKEKMEDGKKMFCVWKSSFNLWWYNTKKDATMGR